MLTLTQCDLNERNARAVDRWRSQRRAPAHKRNRR